MSGVHCETIDKILVHCQISNVFSITLMPVKTTLHPVKNQLKIDFIFIYLFIIPITITLHIIILRDIWHDPANSNVVSKSYNVTYNSGLVVLQHIQNYQQLIALCAKGDHRNVDVCASEHVYMNIQ